MQAIQTVVRGGAGAMGTVLPGRTESHYVRLLRHYGRTVLAHYGS